MKMEEAFKITQNVRKTKSSKIRNDTSVQGTNDSSILSKISTCQFGYFEDNFLKFFGSKIIRRSPLVNRGYYIRAKLLDFVVKEFLRKAMNERNQIVNLGAGFDSTFFRLKNLNLLSQTLFIEIDFPDVIKRKVSVIESNENLLSLCPDLKIAYDINESVVYKSEQSNLILIGIDMRNTKLLETLLKSVEQFSDTVPTLLISEVVLTYMGVNSCNSVIRWINELFQNFILLVYEQINPFDGFGKVMFAHFKKLGSPLKCILKYPDELHQIERYKKIGFDNCFTIKASDFYRDFVDNEEKQRLDKLELFDEYEPWHLKCSHYILLMGTRGKFCSDIISSLLTSNQITFKNFPSLSALQTSSIVIENKLIVKPFPIKFGLRFGHTLCALGSKLFVLGGFGEVANDTSGKHLRLHHIEIVDLKRMTLSIIDPKNKLMGDRKFHCSTTWKREENQESIVISFGRSNPSKLYDSIVELKLIDQNDESNNSDGILNEKNISIEPIENINNSNLNELARFRHATCTDSTSTKLYIYGGKFFDQKQNMSVNLNDFYEMSQSGDLLRKINLDKTIVKPRHSHSMCYWNDKIVISGGCDSNENALNDIILIDSHSFEIEQFIIKNGLVLPRYAHTSHIVDNTLILIGGANYNEQPPGICMINLTSQEALEFKLPYEVNELPLIAVSHQTHMIDSNTILLVGGGAICFTFGNHLNRQPFLIDISDCWSIFKPS